jgi:hypothetical protein
LTRGDDKRQGITQRIDDHMNFRAKATP